MVKKLVLMVALCLSSVSYGIRNGTPAQGTEFLNVHKINFKYTNWGHEKETPFCTGTVIGDYTILTAGHCSKHVRGRYNLRVVIRGVSMWVDSIFIPNEYQNKYNNWRYHFRRFLNQERNTNMNDPAQRRTLEYFKNISQQAFRELAGQDISLIRTQYRIPSYINRTKLNFNFQRTGDQACAVGYGFTYYSYYYRSYMYPKVPYYRVEKMFHVSKACHELWSQHKSDKVTSFGDSGSPLILKDTNEQIGVLSGQMEYEYVYSSAYAKLENHMNFILYYLK